MKTVVVKPVMEYVVTYITGETKTFTSMDDVIDAQRRMIEQTKNRLKWANEDVKRQTETLPILEKELAQFEAEKLKLDILNRTS
jgi:hypothetical protein